MEVLIHMMAETLDLDNQDFGPLCEGLNVDFALACCEGWAVEYFEN